MNSLRRFSLLAVLCLGIASAALLASSSPPAADASPPADPAPIAGAAPPAARTPVGEAAEPGGSKQVAAIGDVARTGEEATPQDVVESLHSVLLDCMKGGCGTSFEARYTRIVAQLDRSFDLPFMARMSIGKAWKTLSDEERRLFVSLQRSLSASTYASNFDSYGGQHFQTLGQEDAARGTILVKTELDQPNDDNVDFDYRLRKVKSGWRIIDVTLDGKVSEITMRRADYGSVIKRDGFPKLVEAIEKKIDKLAKE